MSGELTALEMTLDETLRKYPPAWVGPRKSVDAFEFEGHTVPANAYVNYSSWASHHLPDVFSEPEQFRPERFGPQAKAELPKGAYIPFGGGSRTCIGMRFGQLEVRTIATLIARRFALELPDDFKLEYPPDADDQPQATGCRCWLESVQVQEGARTSTSVQVREGARTPTSVQVRESARVWTSAQMRIPRSESP